MEFGAEKARERRAPGPFVDGTSPKLLGRRTRPHLELHDLAGAAKTAFRMKRSPGRERREHAASLPTAIRIVDPPVEALRIETHGVRDPKRQEPAVDEHEQ